MIMRREVAGQEGDVLRAGDLADLIEGRAGALALADGHAATKIGQLKGGRAITTECGAQKGEEGGVLGDRKEGPLTGGVAARGEVETDEFDFTDEWFGHDDVF